LEKGFSIDSTIRLTSLNEQTITRFSGFAPEIDTEAIAAIRKNFYNETPIAKQFARGFNFGQ
jgi:hypothetical protein